MIAGRFHSTDSRTEETKIGTAFRAGNRGVQTGARQDGTVS